MTSTTSASTASTGYLPFARPSITAREKQAVLEVLDEGWITTGPRAAAFEERFAATVGAHHAVAVNSATAAMHLALEALGVGPDDEVIVPTWTFAATAEVVVYRGARPVLVDVDAATLNATPEAVAAAVTPRTRAVIAVHFAGLPADMSRLLTLLEPHGVALVEDAAHAFPSRVESAGGRFAGTFGVAGAYSFYATKTLTTGEGGMLVTDDSAIAERARLMSLHGINNDAWKRYTEQGSWYYEIVEAGFKYNMSDIMAALGIVQLERADELLEARRRIAGMYTERLCAGSVSDLIELPAGTGDPAHSLHLFVIKLSLGRLSIDRARAIERMRDLRIGTSVHFIPLHLHPYHRRMFGYSAQDFPVASREFERVMSLPIWPGMKSGDVDRVVEALEVVLGDARR